MASKKFVPINASELQMYKVLQRANILSYFDIFIAQGADDVSQLLEADEDEFLEIMSLVGMANKPLHVRRLQKALQDWLINPSLFQQPVVNTNPSVTDALPKELVLAVMGNEVPMPAAIANCPISMDKINKSSAIYKFNPSATSAQPYENSVNETATSLPSASSTGSTGRMSTPPVIQVKSDLVRPSSAIGITQSESSIVVIQPPPVTALTTSVSAPSSPLTACSNSHTTLNTVTSKSGTAQSPVTYSHDVQESSQSPSPTDEEMLRTPLVDLEKITISPANSEEDAPSSNDSAVTVPARCEVKSPSGSTCDTLSGGSHHSVTSQSENGSPMSPLLQINNTVGRTTNGHFAPNVKSTNQGMEPVSEEDLMNQVVSEVIELIKNFETSYKKQETRANDTTVVDLTVKIKKEYLEPQDSGEDAPLSLSKKNELEENEIGNLSTAEIFQQSKIFPTTRILTDQEALINRASFQLCTKMPALLKKKQLLLPLARQVYHIMNRPQTENNNKNDKCSPDNVLADITSLDVHESAPVRSAKRTYQYVLDNLVKEGYAMALQHVIASFQEPDAKKMKTSVSST